MEAPFSHASEIEISSDLMDGTGATGACASKDDLKVTSENFEKARDRVRPSAHVFCFIHIVEVILVPIFSVAIIDIHS